MVSCRLLCEPPANNATAVAAPPFDTRSKRVQGVLWLVDGVPTLGVLLPLRCPWRLCLQRGSSVEIRFSIDSRIHTRLWTRASSSIACSWDSMYFFVFFDFLLVWFNLHWSGSCVCQNMHDEAFYWNSYWVHLPSHLWCVRLLMYSPATTMDYSGRNIYVCPRNIYVSLRNIGVYPGSIYGCLRNITVLARNIDVCPRNVYLSQKHICLVQKHMCVPEQLCVSQKHICVSQKHTVHSLLSMGWVR